MFACFESVYGSVFLCEPDTVLKLCLTAAVLFGTILLSHGFLRLLRRRRKQAGNLPPGLPSLPFIGSMPFLPDLSLAHNFFMEKAKKLGPVVKFYALNRLAVVINGREMIHEAFVKQSLIFASRPKLHSTEFLNPGLKGLFEHPYDSAFQRYHQLSLNILKKFGFGKGIMETRIKVEVEDLLANIRKLNGKAICADQLVTSSVSNVIVSIMFGERYDHSSPELAHLIEKVYDIFHFTKDLAVVIIFPTMKYLPKYRRCVDGLIKVHGELLSHLSSKIDAGVQGELPESFITHFIQMDGPDFDRDQLLFTLRDLFLAGTETTAATLQWALILLANHQDIQKRLYSEIDSVNSSDALPALEIRSRLPFTDAVILEIMRIKTIGPSSFPHKTLDDTHLNGYFIPKGTIVAANLYSAHMDPATWKDPETFDPERFLDADGKVTNREAVVAFSMGRRSCIGQLMAQQEIFLFLTGLVQHFQILPPDGQSTVEYKTFIGLSMAPTDYKIRLLPRSD